MTWPACFRIRLASSAAFLSFHYREFYHFEFASVENLFCEFAGFAQALWLCSASSASRRPLGRCRRGAAWSATPRIGVRRISSECHTPHRWLLRRFPIGAGATRQETGLSGGKPPFVPEKPRIQSRKRWPGADERGHTPM